MEKDYLINKDKIYQNLQKYKNCCPIGNTGRLENKMKLESNKKIINGDVYNIEDAEKIAVATNMFIDSEPSIDELKYYAEYTSQFVAEVLYKAANGNYFVYAMGGNTSTYAQLYVTGRGAGSDIWLIDEDEIPSWMEQYNLVDEYERFMEGK